MQQSDFLPKPVKTLEPQTARKIAAGEVIDRPCAIVRELIDNSIDAKADEITVEICEGGIGQIRVIDNGFGMTKADLEACAKPHATSKIANEDDLLSLNTLGFRGEALVSIASVSRLCITTLRKNDDNVAWKLECENGKRKITPCQWSTGSAIEASGLFENFPARRVFLKKPLAEANLCRQTFIEKALPWTNIHFRFFQDGKEKINLPKNQTLAERFASIVDSTLPVELFHKISAGDMASNGFAFNLVLAENSIYRANKKHLYVFINGRRIWEYSLVQAIEYGATGYFPNGTYPLGALFLEIDPKLVDFNIHPAKREARFKDIAPIHQCVSSTVRNFYKNQSLHEVLQANAFNFAQNGAQVDVHGKDAQYSKNTYDNFARKNSNKVAFFDTVQNFTHGTSASKQNFSTNANFSARHFSREDVLASFASSRAQNAQFAKEHFANYNAQSTIDKNCQDQDLSILDANGAQECALNASQAEINFLGCALGTFLVVEFNNAIYLIDQHAAHERILFNKFMANLGAKQKLLFAYTLTTDSASDDEYLESLIPAMQKVGFTLCKKDDFTWEISTIPIQWSGTEANLAEDLLCKRIAPEELSRSLAATCACRQAVKDGTVLDKSSAEQLARDALSLDDPHCPHGRPIYTVITKDMLFALVRRTE